MSTTVDPDELDPSTATFAPVPPRATRSQQVIAALAVPGVDLVAARAVVEERYRRRRTTRWVRLAGVVAGAVVLGLVALLVGRSEERLDTVASDSNTTTTAVPAAPSTSAAVAAPPVAAAPPVTVPVGSAVAPPSPPAPVVQQPLTASLSTTGDATVGGAVTLRIEWNDADHAVNGDPELTVDWGDPIVASAPSPGDGGVCASVGAPRAGTLERTFRYATAGTRTISVRLSSCGGSGPFGEEVTVTAPIVVGPASTATLVASVGGGTPDPDLASAVRYPADGGPGGALPLRTPAVGSVLTADPARRATVLSAPSWAVGDVVVLAWSDGSCRWGTVGADGGAGGLALDEQGCQAELPVPSTTTVPSTTAPSAPVTTPG